MKKQFHRLTMIIILSLFLITINIPSIKSQGTITVKGYVYINGIKIKPDEVSLMLPDEMRFGFIFNDGLYYIVFTSEEPLTGTFLVIYQYKSYAPLETFTSQEGKNDYIIDLHIETSGGEEPEEPLTNIQPRADAGGPYYEIEDVEVDFDGSGSYDIDGSITKYEWDFGDGSTATGVSPSHTYHLVGDYRVKLTVSDNKGKTDLDITYAYITETPNNPPSKPIVNGTLSGVANTKYNYTILSTDIENDTIQYLIDWDDDTDPTVSDLLPNGTIYQFNHSWIYPGIYTTKAFAIDERDVVSQSTEQVVLIDTVYCENIGYMTDYTGDSIYDLFHSNTTGEETPVKQLDENYLIDDDNDGKYDYQYNTTTFEISEYIQVETQKKPTTLADLINPFLPYILTAIVIVSIVIIPILIFKIKRMPKKKKVYHVKKKAKAKETISNPKDDRIKDIERQVDELLSKKSK